MQSLRLTLLLALLSIQFLTACSNPAGNNNAANSSAANSTNIAQTGPKDNIEELGLLVRLPFEPEEVAWEEKPDQKKLIAVVRFSAENAQKMAAEVAKNGHASPETVTVESWYPNELIAQGELTGESTVKGQS
ncbi:MAG: hypothetical protein ABJB34_09405, partial [Acidobacteriota bacterium]